MELLYELSHQQLVQWLADCGEPRYRADQIFEWVYHHGAADFAKMTNLPPLLREALAARFTLDWPHIVKSTGQPTTKYLLQYPDEAQVECVSIRMDTYRTFCLSSQVGCAMGCLFCASALGSLERNLTAGEIVGQQLAVQRVTHKPRNIVFMGVGEPLANMDNVVAAIRHFTDPHALDLSPGHITVSTAGIVPGIRRLADMNLGVELAVSLNAVTDSQRQQLMPGAARWSIAELLAACRYFARVTGGQPVTFEYVLMADVNDSLEQADHLAELVGDLRHHVNIIPFNAVGHANFRRPTSKRVNQFVAQLRQKGINASVRYSKGTEIDAACGQLRADADN